MDVVVKTESFENQTWNAWSAMLVTSVVRHTLERVWSPDVRKHMQRTTLTGLLMGKCKNYFSRYSFLVCTYFLIHWQCSNPHSALWALSKRFIHDNKSRPIKLTHMVRTQRALGLKVGLVVGAVEDPDGEVVGAGAGPVGIKVAPAGNLYLGMAQDLRGDEMR